MSATATARPCVPVCRTGSPVPDLAAPPVPRAVRPVAFRLAVASVRAICRQARAFRLAVAIYPATVRPVPDLAAGRLAVATVRAFRSADRCGQLRTRCAVPISPDTLPDGQAATVRRPDLPPDGLP